MIMDFRMTENDGKSMISTVNLMKIGFFRLSRPNYICICYFSHQCWKNRMLVNMVR